MSIITLTTDLGLKDYYVASVKGSILSQNRDISIVDISHEIPPFNIAEASFTLSNAYKHFPPGTVHIIGINPSKHGNVKHLACEFQGQFFIGADNGIFTLLFGQKPDHIRVIEDDTSSFDPNFEIRDIFTKAAVHLATGGAIEELGERGLILTESFQLNPVIDKQAIKGHVIHIDSYENAITNISRTMFEETIDDRQFEIILKPGYSTRDIHARYNDVPVGEMVALFGTNDLLEIGINQYNHEHNGGAATLMGLGVKDVIRIEFA